MIPWTSKRIIGISVQIVAYILAIYGGWYTIENWVDPTTHEIKKVLFANVTGTFVIFVIGTLTNCASIYDPYWSIQPGVNLVYLSRYSTVAKQRADWNLRTHVTFMLTQMYVWRLTLNFFYTWPGLGKQDWRYDNLKAKCPKLLWPLLNFFGIMLFPTVLVFAGCMPFYWIVTSTVPFNSLDLIGAAVIFAGIVIAYVADE
jgi:steroid 5-alpha reductase family enzyme